MMSWILIAAFFVVAIIYSSVGFGGGSSYNAILVLFGVDYPTLPIIALICNILVVLGNCFRYWRSGLLQLRPYFLFLVGSVPFAWLGGQLLIDEALFVVILAIALFLSAIAMIVGDARHFISGEEPQETIEIAKLTPAPYFALIIGAILGFLAGLVAIGGGIFLAPLLHLKRWGRSLHISAFCSFFILVNSCFGLVGQWHKNPNLFEFETLSPYILLMFAVIFGSAIGNALGIRFLEPKWVRLVTAILVFMVAIRLFFRFYEHMSI